MKLSLVCKTISSRRKSLPPKNGRAGLWTMSRGLWTVSRGLWAVDRELWVVARRQLLGRRAFPRCPWPLRAEHQEWRPDRLLPTPSAPHSPSLRSPFCLRMSHSADSNVRDGSLWARLLVWETWRGCSV